MKPSQILVRLAMEKMRDMSYAGDIHDIAASVLFGAYSRLEGHYNGESLHSTDRLLLCLDVVRNGSETKFLVVPTKTSYNL